MSQPKRVILRLDEADINEHDLYEPVRLYLEKHGHSASELEADRHFVHIQPPNLVRLQANPKIYITIDLEKDQFLGPLDSDFPHELYRIRRQGDEMVIFGYREGQWLQNYKRQVRQVTDELYPWGMTRRDSYRRNPESHAITGDQDQFNSNKA
ncbi:uncharacterized protein N7459_009844 [Penicillium hispanicum]|uniref:uncharacterized protein n=1 Tax=Penicillium hispanicum TaxID=1080232 RepID=UPI00253FA5DD|nr:uncharacterized protein N7459_009844 [Penicillium hispanicum]KAJ5570414.1 hypothetical protein N7459_009844 [Penicillium hispanicum]